jgi:hypothetical protein
VSDRETRAIREPAVRLARPRLAWRDEAGERAFVVEGDVHARVGRRGDDRRA